MNSTADKGVIKNGFLIKDNKIYDTKIQNFKLKKEIDGNNVIYTMGSPLYKQLYLFEALLYYYPIDTVFKILSYNKFLRKQREQSIFDDKKNHYIANMAVIYNCPPTYLNQRKFQLYKMCQKLKKRID